MAASGDVTFAQDGGYGNVKLHPYIVAIVRWCVSCLWSTATVVLHRLMTAPLKTIAAPKPAKRPAGRDHLHPEPRVHCAVLHQPTVHNLDVIFVHGLYGSLGNTWRQGEWRSKYPVGPEKVHLRRPKATLTPCKCSQCENANTEKAVLSFVNENRNNDNRNMFNDCLNNEFANIDEKFYKNIKKILPNEDVFTTEKFYNNTLLDQVEIVDNYDSQAKFVSDLFKSSCDSACDSNEQTINDKNRNNDSKNVFNDKDSCKCNVANEVGCKCKSDAKCEVGCGCICDQCYSLCWPKDWIKVDYPDARVISINYTSDPHLWRPLWIKESKRLRLHERAEQMTQQLLDLGVGSKPVIWVGHSKGGLFIKQIYCEAYEAYLKTSPKGNLKRPPDEQNMTEFDKDNEMNNLKDLDNNDNRHNDNTNRNRNNDDRNRNNDDRNRNNDSVNGNNDNEIDRNVIVESQGMRTEDDESWQLQSLNNEEDLNGLKKRAFLWQRSAGFMFYSVPHRGSPLADIKTPVTARSIELLEISKDCSLVLSLQQRWLRAAAPAPPAVRSLVETRRTLMSVLWLRIVSADSADPGIGALCGVSVDHREICKPSSRHCLLYTELATLIGAALQKFHLK